MNRAWTSIAAAALTAAVFLSGTAAAAPGNMKFTKHNLSATGPGLMKASGEQEMCIFCHSPHSASPAMPRWNQTLPSLVYTPYSSSTMRATPGQPSYTSKLCLSCHDGTVAPGRVSSRSAPVPVKGSLSDRANLSTDLSDDHPISFVYDSALAAENRELVNPVRLTGLVRLDVHGELQCTTCHDPHSDTNPMFLVKSTVASELCITCHVKSGWPASSHATSNATWNRIGVNPWPHTPWTTVGANGCENCHSPHKAGRPRGLLNFPREEDNCLSCHDGNVGRKDIALEIQKPYSHGVQFYEDLHDPVELARTMPRHVECQDCHNPHATLPGTASAPNISGPLTRVAGISISGARVTASAYQYEVCFRCHADNPNVPAPAINRKILQPNIRLKLQPSNPSFHPVAGLARNSNVPSLISPRTPASILYCTDCHSNDAGPGAGGTGPRGPHGSMWPFLLEREYRTADNTVESIQAYALCYKCHDRASILGNRSFKKHDKHITDARTPCSVCHDPHGISSTQGNSINNSYLINFDRSIVLPDPVTGRLEFRSTGALTGECYLQCHGQAHSPKRYRP